MPGGTRRVLDSRKLDFLEGLGFMFLLMVPVKFCESQVVTLGCDLLTVPFSHGKLSGTFTYATDQGVDSQGGIACTPPNTL